MSQNVTLSDAGEIVHPQLHDARLLGFMLLAERQLLLSFEYANGAEGCLLLSGVEQLKADDFRQGNIVLDVTMAQAGPTEIGDIAFAYGMEESNQALRQLMDRLMQEKLLVVRVNPSYGALVVCICRSVEAIARPLLGKHAGNPSSQFPS